jgi:hypothetical protein
MKMKRKASLINTGNYKTRKGEAIGYKTIGLHLAPANLSGYNVCIKASAGCKAACLNTAGRGAMSSVQSARIAKTRLFIEDQPQFMTRMHDDMLTAIKSARRANMIPAARLNLTSDLSWESIGIWKDTGDKTTLMSAFSDIQFYDYTACASRMMRWINGDMPANYHLTFSRKENTPDLLVDSIVKSGGNVAVVFDKLPTTWRGHKVVDGDKNDLRFLDPVGVIVGLKAKGEAKTDDSGFVIHES